MNNIARRNTGAGGIDRAKCRIWIFSEKDVDFSGVQSDVLHAPAGTGSTDRAAPGKEDTMKKYILNTEDRKTLVNRIGELAGQKMKYTGVPGCAYEGSGFTVGKDGTLVTADDADETIISTLLAEGLVLADGAVDDPIPDEEYDEETEEESAASLGIRDAEEEAAGCEEEPQAEEPAEPAIDALTISLPMEGHTPDSLRNLVNMVYSRGPLLSKATGGCFKAGAELTKAAGETGGLADAEEFRLFIENLIRAHGELEGIRFEEDKVTFTGFPMTEDPEKIAAFQMIACAMNKQAKEQKRIQAKEIVTESEKYTFRNWLVRLGMGGADSKTARSILLENLSGHTAFRNKAEEEKWKANMKAKRQAAKAQDAVGEAPAEDENWADKTE